MFTSHKTFPGGSVVKNLPANAGDTGLIPDPGRSHTPRSNKARPPQLNLCFSSWELQVLSPYSTTAEAQAP